MTPEMIATLRLRRIRAAFAQEPFAMLPDALDGIVAGLRAHDFGDMTASEFLAEPSAERLDEFYAARAAARPSAGAVAVVPVLGPIVKRDSLFSMMEGGTSTTRLGAQLRQLAADDSVATVLLNVDSPGGTVSGLPELAAEIRRTAQSKHVIAIANDLAASAAYWIASQADELVATPEALVGSVGVFTRHVDCSGFNEQNGMKPTYIHAGRFKVEGNPDEPLSDDAREHIQSIVDGVYSMFVSDVAKGRSAATGTSITPAQVRADYGEGRVLMAKDAKAAGMIDRIATYAETVARLSGVKPAGAKAEGEPLVPTLEHMDGEPAAGVSMAPIEYAEDSVPLPTAEDRLRLDSDAWLFNS